MSEVRTLLEKQTDRLKQVQGLLRAAEELVFEADIYSRGMQLDLLQRTRVWVEEMQEGADDLYMELFAEAGDEEILATFNL